MVGDCNAAIPIQPVGAKNNVVDAHVGLVPGPQFVTQSQPAGSSGQHLHALAPEFAAQLYLPVVLPPDSFRPPARHRWMVADLQG